MAAQIRWNLNVDVADGPQIAAADVASVDAYDRLEVAIPPSSGTSTTDVDVQPGPADRVLFLLITASTYGAKLTYTVDGTTHAIPLDTPQLFTGAGSIGLLQQPPKKLLFSNKLDGNPTALVQVLVGRLATPPPPPVDAGGGGGGEPGGGEAGGGGEGESGGEAGGGGGA